MKPTLKKIIIFIIVFTVFLVVTQWILWSGAFGKNNSQTHEYPTYDSLEEFTEKNSNSEYEYKIIAQDDKYAVCFVDSKNSYELKILSKTGTAKWIVLNKDTDYKYKFYTNQNDSIDLSEIVTYKIANSEKNIVVVSQYMSSGKEGILVSNANERKLKIINDSQNTKFYYSANQSKTPEMLFAYYIGFVDNFDEDTYILNINDKEYPYKEWKKLLRR